MNLMCGFYSKARCFLVLSLLLPLLLPTLSRAATMGDYCVVPAFIGQNVPANLLLMIDNSSSMFDLAYSDEGKKVCSGTTTACTTDADCAGVACSTARQPYYCYDETYSNSKTYVGYFSNKDPSNNDIYYNYRPDTDDFAVAATAFPADCPTSGLNVSFTIPSTMCLEYTPDKTSVVRFIAKGNYLNWLTTSKFDVEKKILTGGKYDGAGLIAESRGCVGRGYIKQPLSSNFVNYDSTMVNFVPTPADPNIANKLPLVFTVRGPLNPDNVSAPSAGGQSYIDLFGGRVYNSADCQGAVQAIADGGNADIKKTVAACLKSDAAQYCALNPSLLCTYSHAAEGSPNCDQTLTNVCSGDLTKTYIAACSTSNPTTSCTTLATSYCSGDHSKICTATTPDCQKTGTFYCNYGSPTRLLCGAAAAAGSSPCDISNNSKRCYKNVGTTVVDTGTNCSNNNQCATGQLCLSKGNFACVSAGDAYDYGTCSYTTGGVNYGTCQGSYNNYVGPCLFDGGTTTEGKVKVAFQQSMQACWQARGTCSNNASVACYADSDCGAGTCSGLHPIGTDEVRSADNQCSRVYATYFTCSDNHSQTCSFNSDCTSNICMSGPNAIAAGSPALLCGMNYVGQYYVSSGGSWVRSPSATDDQIKAAHTAFCRDSSVPNVTDPTDAPSETPLYDNLPAILSGVGVESQMGSPIKSMRVKIATPTVPTGLIQEFGGKVRIGAMSFNYNGSASEVPPATSPPIPVIPNVCSNDATRPCTMMANCVALGTCNSDCVSPGTCGPTSAGTTNLDGGSVIYPVGRGLCATMTTVTCTSNAGCTSPATCINGFCGTRGGTVCATDTSCTSPDVCIKDDVGDHTAAGTLIKTLDDIKAYSWTPFAEAYYNAIGYFARTDSGASRTDLRINSLDFDATLNPSQFRCQQNYVLLVSDGSSTADRNASSSGLANRYHTAAGKPTSWDSTCSYYGGSKNLPILSWLAKNRNIATFSTSATSTATPVQGRDSVTTYVVYNGASNGAADECSSQKLLSDTAVNGGTTLKQATNPADLETNLRSTFEELAAKSASGTAASILSNSEGSGANILQAIFFPRKVFEGQTEAKWLGELNNVWYYVDPFIGKSSTREDTDGPSSGVLSLNLKTDYVLQFGFDNVKGTTTVKVLSDSNGDGSGDANPSCLGVDPRCVRNPYPYMDSDPNAVYLESPDKIKSLWKAGDLLWRRDISATGSPRTIYTPCIDVTGAAISDATCAGSRGLTQFSYSGAADSSTGSGDNSYAFQANLQYPSDNAGAKKLMKYVHGFDYPAEKDTWRDRTVKQGTIPAAAASDAAYVTNPRDKGIGVWKLGDIISSTPRVQSSVRQNGYNLPKPSGYSDVSYGDQTGQYGYTSTSAYKARGMVYAGANDGMLHAFKLGALDVSALGDQKATVTNKDADGNVVTTPVLGSESWAFMPQNVLPYLKYYAQKDYGHLYYMDGNTTLVDASVGIPTGCSSSNYWECSKKETDGRWKTDGSNWRTILVGGMGIGGAARNSDADCGTVPCVKTPISGVGYSAYYGLDVTAPNSPKFLWEFSDAALPAADRGLGFATSGAAIVKVSARSGSGGLTGSPVKDNNGRWFAVFGSGPTGPIDTNTYRFLGGSSQPLKVYVVDLNARPPFVNGTNYWVLNNVYTGSSSLTSTVASATPAPLNFAFAGSLVNGSIDVDRWNSSAPGNYQDDAVYFGYSQAASNEGPWTSGGVLKIVTNEDPNPANWKLVKVLDGTGPVTTGIGRLQDRKEHKLWLYFGTGRYFYMRDDFATGSDERIYGIQDMCYRDGLTRSGNSANPKDSLDPACATMTSGLVNQAAADQTSTSGWYIPLDTAHTTDSDPSKILGKERVITDPVAMTNGAVFFSSYKPNNDFCQYGGLSYMWAVKFDTGTEAPAAALQGKALVQVSTGQFKEVDLATAFNDKLHRRMGDQNAMTGKPPTDSPPIVSKSNNKPVKRIMHIQER